MKRDWTLAAGVILMVGGAGLVLAFQGWRGRGPDEDVTAAIVRAAALVARGQLPTRGSLSDLDSYFPAGTAWLAVPGVLMFSDARLVELLGSGALYLGSLAGVFLIGRRYFGALVASLATLLYGLSAPALIMASQLWPRGHPFFFIWMVYLTGRWVDRRDARYLAGACTVWAAGMYVYMELAPAFFILPGVWWLYRPPVTWRALLGAAVVTIALWFPYLTFQWDRGFIDLQSQLLMRPLDRRDVETVPGCGQDPTPGPGFRAATRFHGSLAEGAEELVRSATARAPAIADLMLVNLRTRVVGGEFVLLCLLGGGLVTAGGFGKRRWHLPGPWLAAQSSIAMISALFAFSLLAMEFTLRWFATSPVATILVTVRRVCIGLLLLSGVLAATNAQVERLASALGSTGRPRQESRLLVVALLIPWTILLLLTEGDKGERMFFVWPLQVMFIAAFVCAACERLPTASIFRWALPLLVAALIGANSLVLGRARDWVHDGWAGPRQHGIETVETLLARCESR